MDSVIAKLDGSVFGMLIEQEPHILICGITGEDDIVFINSVRPDFACADGDLSESELSRLASPAIRILDSPDSLPNISGADSARALSVSTSSDPEELKEMIRKNRPDTLIFTLSGGGEKEYQKFRILIRAARSTKPEAVDWREDDSV